METAAVFWKVTRKTYSQAVWDTLFYLDAHLDGTDIVLDINLDSDSLALFIRLNFIRGCQALLYTLIMDSSLAS